MAKPIKETICVRLSPVLMAALRGWVRLHQKSFSGGIEVLVVSERFQLPDADTGIPDGPRAHSPRWRW